MQEQIDISRMSYHHNDKIQFDGGRGLTEDEGRIGDWMQTVTGKRFYPNDPRAEDVDIIDIAFALGNMSRYGGHCRFYSVAEHSILVSLAVPQDLALEGLLHDGTEAYVTDMIRQIKRTLGADNDYFKIDKKVRLAIAEHFGLQPEEPQVVKEMDVAVLGLEKEALWPNSDPWHLPFPAPRDMKIYGYPPDVAQMLFLTRYCEICGFETRGLADQMRRLHTELRQNLRRHQIVS